MRAGVSLTALWLLVSASACQSERAPAATSARTIEVRGADGNVALQLVVEPGGMRWLAPTGGGRIVALEGPAGAQGWKLQGGAAPLSLIADATGLRIEAAGKARVAFSRVDDRLRVADGQGFPLARVRLDGEHAQLHDAAGILRAQSRDEGGRIVVTDRDAQVLGYVVGLDEPSRAALLFMPGLSEGERILLLAPGPTWP